MGLTVKDMLTSDDCYINGINRPIGSSGLMYISHDSPNLRNIFLTRFAQHSDLFRAYDRNNI